MILRCIINFGKSGHVSMWCGHATNDLVPCGGHTNMHMHAWLPVWQFAWYNIKWPWAFDDDLTVRIVGIYPMVCRRVGKNDGDPTAHRRDVDWTTYMRSHISNDHANRRLKSVGRRSNDYAHGLSKLAVIWNQRCGSLYKGNVWFALTEMWSDGPWVARSYLIQRLGIFCGCVFKDSLLSTINPSR